MSLPPLALHATTVAVGGRAVVLFGPSGSGKSALALWLMAFGGQLVADDCTIVRREGESLVATAPAAIRGRIEARGMGLLQAASLLEAPVALAVDMGQIETQRLPPYRWVNWLDLAIPLLHKSDTGHFAPALVQYLKAGRKD